MVESKNIVLQWMERADYDLSAAAAMRKSGHLLYVAFMCQQAVEKTLKATWCRRRDDSPPFTHNLATLAESLGLDISEKQKILLDRLGRHYIVGRYPTFKQKLASALNKEDVSDMLKQTEDFVKWCRKSIPTLKKS
ncbi:MAG: HEPN domain-containing protein [Pseudomonadota bacterium]